MSKMVLGKIAEAYDTVAQRAEERRRKLDSEPDA